jgi:hypothetical protein
MNSNKAVSQEILQTSFLAAIPMNLMLLSSRKLEHNEIQKGPNNHPLSLVLSKPGNKSNLKLPSGLPVMHIPVRCMCGRSPKSKKIK